MSRDMYFCLGVAKHFKKLNSELQEIFTAFYGTIRL